VLDSVQTRAVCEHPSRENPPYLRIERDLVNLDEGICLGRLGLRARIANPGRHLQRAKLHRFIDVYVECVNASGNLVDAGEYGNPVRNPLGFLCAGGNNRKSSERNQANRHATNRMPVVE